MEHMEREIGNGTGDKEWKIGNGTGDREWNGR